MSDRIGVVTFNDVFWKQELDKFLASTTETITRTEKCFVEFKNGVVFMKIHPHLFLASLNAWKFSRIIVDGDSKMVDLSSQVGHKLDLKIIKIPRKKIGVVTDDEEFWKKEKDKFLSLYNERDIIPLRYEIQIRNGDCIRWITTKSYDKGHWYSQIILDDRVKVDMNIESLIYYAKQYKGI